MKKNTGLMATVALTLFGGGVQGALMQFEASLTGAAENPSNASPGTGFATVIYDNVAHTMLVDFSFTGLLGTTTASHIHGPAGPLVNASVITTTPTFAGTPLGVTSGSLNLLLDLTLASSFNPSFVSNPAPNGGGGTVAGAETAFATHLLGGLTYLNIHTAQFPGGEIRGQLILVPEISTAAPWFLLSLGALYGFARHRRGPAA